MKIVRSARSVSSIRLVLCTSLLLGHAAAHATSFDCTKGRSIPEQLICHTGDLSKLDDQLGKLYGQARRRVDDPKAFRADSDSKWAWREANCRDEACLRTWYSGRIDELQRLLVSLRTGSTPKSPTSPASDAAGAAGAAGASEPPVPALRALPLDVGRRAFASESKGDGGNGNRDGNNGAEASAETNADSSADTHARHGKATALARTESSATPLQCTAAEPGLILHDQCATVLKQDVHSQYSPRPGDWFCGVATLAQSRAATPAQ